MALIVCNKPHLVAMSFAGYIVAYGAGWMVRVMLNAAKYFLPQKIHNLDYRARVICKFVADSDHEAPPAIRPANKQPITIDVYSTIASFFSSLIIFYPYGNDWSSCRGIVCFCP